MERSRLLGSSDRAGLLSPYLFSSENEDGDHLPQLSNLLCDETYLSEMWHGDEFFSPPEEDNTKSTWRLKAQERMKTFGVALVVCLNIGTDPPDIVKPTSCARRECWIDPTGMKKEKGLELIGNALQQQYEKWHSKAKYKQCLDPSVEDLKRICINLRKTARSDRLLLHYNGHGVPRPTRNGEVWVFGRNYTHYMPVAICELKSWLGDPAIYVIDCSGAGTLIPHFVDVALEGDGYGPSTHHTRTASELSNGSGMESTTIVLAACRANEMLPLNPQYPADIFTSCLTTPIPTALRWFILQNQFSMGDVSVDLAETIPGKDSDRKSPRGVLNWIFTAITDTIAWNTLPSHTFQKMFRQDLLVASLFRNFLLAKRILKNMNCTPQSWPPLPDSTTHPLWGAWDLAAEACILGVHALQQGSAMVDPRNNMPLAAVAASSSFFTDHLTAFEIWLDFESTGSDPPLHLPILLQVLLSQTHRLRALALLRRYLALGPHAANLALVVGIFPYLLKLLQSSASDIRQLLICIWAAIVGFDPSCRNELIRDKSQGYFMQGLASREMSPNYRCMAAFTLAEICRGNPEGRQTCLQQGLHRSCSTLLTNADVTPFPDLKKWICLCLCKLCEDFLWAKYLCLTETGHPQLYPLLLDGNPTVRAAAVLALGELFGASSRYFEDSPQGQGQQGQGQQMHTPPPPQRPGQQQQAHAGYGVAPPLNDKAKQLLEIELTLAIQILDSCTDGSVMVRREAVIALSKFVSQPVHNECIKIVVTELRALVLSQGRLAWNLTPAHIHGITMSVRGHLLAIGFDSVYSHAQFTPVLLQRLSTSSSSLVEEPVHRHPSPHLGAEDEHLPPAKAVTMAQSYFRLWMALQEVYWKDPHSETAKAAGAIISRLKADVETEEASHQGTDDESVSASMGPDGLAGSFSGRPSHSTGQQPSGGGGGGIAFGHQPQQHQQQVPYGHGRPPQSPAMGSMASLHTSGSGTFGSMGSVTSLPSMGSMASISALGSYSMDEQGGPGPVSPRAVAVEAAEPVLVSYFYDWCRKIFLASDDGYDPDEDPLSSEGQRRMYREARLAELLEAQRRVAAPFEPLNEKHEPLMDRKAREDLQLTKSMMVASLPQSVTKFEQKALITIENPDATSVVLFHALQDVLAVAGGNTVSIWSLAHSGRVLTINNDLAVQVPELPPPSAASSPRGGGRPSMSSSSAKDKNTSPPIVGPGAASRITSMAWLNESHDALLMVGSDDGTVKVWRDVADSESLKYGSPGVTMASAFLALPDIAETSHGSGLVMSWMQPSGALVVGGNSCTVRVWDLACEQSTRTFATGLETCVTSLATQEVQQGLSMSFPMSQSLGGYRDLHGYGAEGSAGRGMACVFAGFADGTVAVFDERVSAAGGRVHLSREHAGWIISTHLRTDVPEIITASVQGVLKFTDLRTMRSFRTLEVQKKSSLTAMATHPCAPVIATGSHAQFIKILTFGGDQLGSIIKYHDGFLGQRIGPVSSLAFHPTRMLLAAGSTDSIVSIYGTAES